MSSMLPLASVLRLRTLALAAFALATLLPSGAEAITGVCPDGSIFIVKNVKYIPCKAAKLVERGAKIIMQVPGEWVYLDTPGAGGVIFELMQRRGRIVDQ